MVIKGVVYREVMLTGGENNGKSVLLSTLSVERCDTGWFKNLSAWSQCADKKEFLREGKITLKQWRQKGTL